MKRILEENQEPRIQVYCHNCKTLFDYQLSDVESFEEDWIEKERWCPDTHHFREKRYITCPKCGKEHVISDNTWSEFAK